MTEPLLITVAPTGAETAKADCPQLPTTLDELVETAVACEAAGAAMIHVHIRDDEHRPTLDGQRLKDTVVALRESTSLVVQLSTGGSVHDPLDLRLKVLDAEPDSCSLTMGTTNFGDDVFSNPWPFVTELYQLSQEREVVPEFELFDLGQVHALTRLLDKYGPPYGGKIHCDLVMGVPGGMNGTADALVAAVRDLPASVTSLVGHRHRPVHAGGDVRQPLEGRPPPRRHGGRADDQPRRPGRVQRPARRARRRGRPPRAAHPHDHLRGPRAPRRQGPLRRLTLGRSLPRNAGFWLREQIRADWRAGTRERSVDEGLHPVGEDLLGEDGRARDAHALDHVAGGDPAALGALGADGHLALGDDGGQQVR